MVLLPLIIFAFGLLIGSFLNVVILRLNTGRSVVVGRSACATCARTLHWYELVPVFSFLGLGGKCHTCKQSISFQYPLVELLTGIYFVLAYSRLVIGGGFTALSWLSFVFALVVGALLLIIAVYDLRHQIIPDMIVYPFILIALASVLYRALTVPTYSFAAALVGGVFVALPFFLIWFFSKGRAMGFGDVKLALGIGWLVGLSAGFAVFVLSFWIGGIVGLFLLALSRKYKMKSEVPFGPFLIIALCIVGLWGVTLSTLFPIWL